MGQTTPAAARCPRCSAAVRPGAPWCTQCYEPAGAAAPSPPDEGPPAGGVRVAAVPEVAAPELAAPTGAWPCSACSQPNDLSLAACRSCGTPFLAGARGERPTVVLPGVGDLLALSPVRRVALAVSVVVAFVVVSSLLALLMA